MRAFFIKLLFCSGGSPGWFGWLVGWSGGGGVGPGQEAQRGAKPEGPRRACSARLPSDAPGCAGDVAAAIATRSREAGRRLAPFFEENPIHFGGSSTAICLICFSLLVLQGIYHYSTYLYFFQGS